MNDAIRGGYYLKARSFYESKIAHAPPHAREVFDYFLCKAFWKDGEELQRGQLLTSYRAIQEDLRWYIGNRPVRYKKHQIETAVKLLARAGAVTTAKTTRGMIVTICNYDFYQTQESYESHSESDLKAMRDCHESPTIDETVKTGETGNQSTPAPEAGFPHDLFRRFKTAHRDCQPVKDFQFQQAIAAYPGADVAEAVAAFERQVAGANRIQFPVREFEKYLRRSGGKKDGSRGNSTKKTRAQYDVEHEQRRIEHLSAVGDVITQPLPPDYESQTDRLKRLAEERQRKQSDERENEG